MITPTFDAAALTTRLNALVAMLNVAAVQKAPLPHRGRGQPGREARRVRATHMDSPARSAGRVRVVTAERPSPGRIFRKASKR